MFSKELRALVMKAEARLDRVFGTEMDEVAAEVGEQIMLDEMYSAQFDNNVQWWAE